MISADRVRSDLAELASAGRREHVAPRHRPHRHKWGYTDEQPSWLDRVRYGLPVRAKEVERRRADSALTTQMAKKGMAGESA